MGHPIDHIRTHLEIPPEMEQSLRSIMTQHTFKRGETISAISDMRSNVFYIQNGAARVYYLKSGKEHTYSFAFDDEFVTLSPYLWKTPDNIPTIEFLEPTEVIFVPIPGTHFLMQDYAREHLAEASTFLLTALIEHTHFRASDGIGYRTLQVADKPLSQDIGARHDNPDSIVSRSHEGDAVQNKGWEVLTPALNVHVTKIYALMPCTLCVS